MKILIASLTVPDLDAATRQGASRSFLGPCLDGGSYCAINDAPVGEVLDAAHAARDGFAILYDLSPEELRDASERGALCLIVADGAGKARPLAIFYGRGLPALGAIPACTLQDLQHTWTALAGGMPSGGRHLLHEQPEEWDPQLERQLTQRLRQLYGE